MDWRSSHALLFSRMMTPCDRRVRFRQPVAWTVLVGLILFAVKRLHITSLNNTKCIVTELGGNPNNNKYGAWFLCSNLVTTPAVLVSVGSGCDSSFEQAFLEAYPGSVVHVLDPTITYTRFAQCASSSPTAKARPKAVDSMSFWRVGLSNETKMVIFNKSPDPRIASKSEVRLANYSPSDGDSELVVDMPTMYAMLGITSPPILKIDIEGSEYGVLKRFCAEAGRLKRSSPAQILVEFHDRLFREKPLFGRVDAYECLRRVGYRLEYESSSKEEVLFVRRVQARRRALL